MKKYYGKTAVVYLLKTDVQMEQEKLKRDRGITQLQDPYR